MEIDTVKLPGMVFFQVTKSLNDILFHFTLTEIALNHAQIN